MTYLKTICISFLIICISFLHIQTVATEHGLHMLHQQLFFIPIILTGFWFGLRIGLITAILVCGIYAPLVIGQGGQHSPTSYSVLFTQLAMYLFVSVLIGWLSDRQKKQQEKLTTGERATALAKAASTLSFEIKDVVASLDKIHLRASGLKNPAEETNFQQELDRLNHLVEVLIQYVPPEEKSTLSTDLNQLLKASYKKYHQRAKSEGIELILQPDDAGCPSMIVSESLNRILDSLIENALEFSVRGQKISLRSKRGGSTCFLDVTDEGKGVAEADRKKLFTPFFTTKQQGSGLALASGRKVLRDHGGDLVYLPEATGGTTFRVIVPRENVEKNVDEFARGQKVTS